MPVLTPAALRTQIASGETAPLYVLLGEDDAEKASVAAQFAELVDEGLRAFNIDRLYGGETGVEDLIAAANTLPMMAPRRIVLVLEAEKLLIPKRESKAADEDQERLGEFVKDPPPQTSVVFVCGALDKRRRIVQLLMKTAQVVDTGTIADAADAEQWVKVRAVRDKVNLDAGAVRALVDRAGLDIVRLRSGFERVSLYAMGQARVTADDVKEAVPPGPDAAADWGIANAIDRNDAADALRELGAALDAGAPPLFVMGQIRVAAEKRRGAALPTAIDALFRTDLALKSSGGDPRVLLERLVVELCGSGKSLARSR